MAAAPLLLVAGNLALALAMLASEDVGLGREAWHDEAAFAVLALAALAGAPLLWRRRLTTLLLASAGAWCVATGLLLVYAKPYGLVGRSVDWWHAVTGVAFVLAFLAHWARNHRRLVQLVARLHEGPAAMAAFVGAWSVLLAAAVAVAVAPGRAGVSRLADAQLDALTTVVGLAVAVGVGGAFAWRGRRGPLATQARNRLRGAIDASLWLSTWIAALSGFAVLYLARSLRSADAYWPTVAAHVVAGLLLLGLVAGHVAFNARPLRSHATRAPATRRAPR